MAEWAIFTTNGKPADEYTPGRPTRPVAVVRNGVIREAAPESKVGLCAYAIYCARAGLGWELEKTIQAWRQGNVLMAIEHDSVPHIGGVGILRMTHRADTNNTKAWLRQTSAECDDTIRFYGEVAAHLGIQVPDLEEFFDRDANVP